MQIGLGLRSFECRCLDGEFVDISELARDRIVKIFVEYIDDFLGVDSL